MSTDSQNTERPVTDRQRETAWGEVVEIALMGLTAPTFPLEDILDRVEGRR